MKRSAPPREWIAFLAWCRARGLRGLPAHPWTVSAYLRWVEAHHGYAQVLRHLRVISHRHLMVSSFSPERHPLVLRTLGAIKARSKTAGARSALFDDADVLATPSDVSKKRGGGKKKLSSRMLREDAPSPATPRGRPLRRGPRLVSRRPEKQP
ncbi:hypothetical protein [Varunaivibrio sulfuroxidans]|uniref:Uncharacterized protein n=1 Tax=Varunaivibrio sulfuroxidans TaxID=1773489 RepID=A0A4R3J7Y5_9PROT|nr:hypothetical protein [Varunaivibrio sulfuroxidans]TCS60610.1 hypothetical protein EDD55_11085 [Varunaivibrio sulfuroxidans]WES30099.1 hypothetical protein P3M64_10685 [Varunaivibrio sulfuroxidans]